MANDRKPHGATACFSFHPRKILTTGEGGMITTADDELAARLRRLRMHGIDIDADIRHRSGVMIERYAEPGFNSRMTDMQAAIGRVSLPILPEPSPGDEISPGAMSRNLPSFLASACRGARLGAFELAKLSAWPAAGLRPV